MRPKKGFAFQSRIAENLTLREKKKQAVARSHRLFRHSFFLF
jgi:hypothetical protein